MANKNKTQGGRKQNGGKTRKNQGGRKQKGGFLSSLKGILGFSDKPQQDKPPQQQQGGQRSQQQRGGQRSRSQKD